ncbi:rod shape-determining protein MreD [Acidocella sp.]|uniref:rod shape-determining protein MreD n=1 Tax=Acidocella sp. TaxID=50710 RepID=UPI002605A1A8|nr:rod shape-determining protein MreD [Acidocella sp.]
MARLPASRRRQSFWRQLDAAARWAVPGALLAFGLFLLGLPLHIPGQALLRPAYAMGCVYFWSLFRPASLPAPVTGLIGLLLDLMGTTPPGLWAVLLILLQAAVLATRRRLAPRRFLLTWAAFCALAALAALLGWAAQSGLAMVLLPAWPPCLEIIISAAAYPALAMLLVRIHRGPAAVESA